MGGFESEIEAYFVFDSLVRWWRGLLVERSFVVQKTVKSCSKTKSKAEMEFFGGKIFGGSFGATCGLKLERLDISIENHSS